MVNQMTANSKREDEEKRLEAEEGLAKIELEVSHGRSRVQVHVYET